jgi:hypothetical protein
MEACKLKMEPGVKDWIRIRIKMKGWIRICIKVAGWIRIPIKVKMLDPDLH